MLFYSTKLNYLCFLLKIISISGLRISSKCWLSKLFWWFWYTRNKLYMLSFTSWSFYGHSRFEFGSNKKKFGVFVSNPITLLIFIFSIHRFCLSIPLCKTKTGMSQRYCYSFKWGNILEKYVTKIGNHSFFNVFSLGDQSLRL